MAKSYEKLANDILAAVGGKENIVSAAHCATRLRLKIKDESAPDLEALRGVEGVIGVQVVAGQLQIIIGGHVSKVYKDFCRVAGIAEQEAIHENLDAPRQPVTPKSVFSDVMKYVAGTMIDMIPVMMGCSLFHVIKMFLGSSMFGLLPDDNDFMVLTDIVYNAFFVFMPIFVCSSAAKRLKMNQYMGMLMGAILCLPDFVALAGTGFTVYGIPCTITNYASTVVPALLCTWSASCVERFLSKHMPDAVTVTFTPLFTLLIILPVNLCLLAPVGNMIGTGLSMGMNAFSNLTGALGTAIMGGLWQFLVMTGMHGAFGNIVMTNFFATGVDSFIMVAWTAARWSVIGISIGALLRMKGRRNRSTNLGMLVACTVGGISEPVLFGICVQYRKTMLALFAGGFAGALYAALTHTVINAMGGGGMFTILCYGGGDSGNFINGIISCLIATGVAAAITYFFGFSKEEAAAK